MVTEFLVGEGIATNADCTFSLYLPNREDFHSRVKHEFPVVAISLSDYNAIREMLGYKTVTLEENEFTTQWHMAVTTDEQEEFIRSHAIVDGLGESHYPEITNQIMDESGVEFLTHTLKNAAQTDDPVSIIALGPLTNLAKVIQEDPQSLAGLGELISMGGSYQSHGNCSPVAEYNYWCDPHAAEIVYRAFEDLPVCQNKKIHMVGLDVTRKIVLTPNILEYMCYVNPQIGERIRKITRFYFDFHWKQEGVIGCVINDPLAVAYFVDRTLCSGIDACTRIATDGLCIGQSVVDGFDFWHGHKNSHVLTKTSPLAFMQMFFDRVLGVHPKVSCSVLEQIMKGDSQ